MRLIFIFVAMALAAGAFALTMHFSSKESAPAPVVVAPTQVITKEVPTVDIYTAKQSIPIGSIIKPEMLDIQPWPKHLMLPDMVAADPSKPNDLLKMVARTPFEKGEPIILTKLANDKDPSFLAAALPKGMRVVTIATDGIAGVAGFVFPGDRIDVLITHDIALTPDQDAKPGIAPAQVKKDPITEVLLSNVRVMAVNQKTVTHSGEPPMPPSSVSLEVSPSDAQKLRLTEGGNGRLSLALRSLKDREETELARPTGLGDLSRLTPPSYFPVLYDGTGQVAGGPVAGNQVAAAAPDKSSKMIITVVRGVKPEDVEVERP